MKIKRTSITASKRDELLQRKADYEADFNYRKAKYDEQYANFQKMQESESNRLAKAIKDAIGNTTLDISVDVHQDFTRNKYTAYISDEHDQFNTSKALSWSYSVSLDSDGNVVRETSSWSGLNATTIENIENLKEIVRVLESLNRVDWKTLMSEITPPKYKDYVTAIEPRHNVRPDFMQELYEIDLDDMVGTSKGIVCWNSKYGGDDGLVYRFITKATPTSYRVFDVPKDDADSGMTYDEMRDEYSANSRTIRKSTMLRDILDPETIKSF